MICAVSMVLALAIAQPSAVITRNGGLDLHLPASIMQSAEVERQLTSGLTTAFVITARSGVAAGGVRIEIRYELWQEQYLVTVIDGTGKQQTLTLASREKLVQWWSETPFTAIPSLHDPAAGARAQIVLRVLPFSAREQADAQRWLSSTLNSEAAADKRLPTTAAKILMVIVGTSIRRKPLLEYRWSVEAGR